MPLQCCRLLLARHSQDNRNQFDMNQHLARALPSLRLPHCSHCKLWLLWLIAVSQAHYLAGLAFLQESNYNASIRHLCKVCVDHACRHCLLDS